MKYVLDTNVVSALRVRGRNRPVELWAASVPLADLFVTATTVAEIERGAIARERSDTGQGSVLRRWFDEHTLPAFADRVLPAARILAAYRIPEHSPFDDARIAASAQSAHMTIATRNINHFEPSARDVSIRGMWPDDRSLIPQTDATTSTVPSRWTVTAIPTLSRLKIISGGCSLLASMGAVGRSTCRRPSRGPDCPAAVCGVR